MGVWGDFFLKKICSGLLRFVLGCGRSFFLHQIFWPSHRRGGRVFEKKKRPTQQGRQSRVRRRLTHKDARRADQKRSRRNMSVAALKNSNLSIILVFAFLIPLSFSVLWCLGVASQKRVCRDDFLLVGKKQGIIGKKRHCLCWRKNAFFCFFIWEQQRMGLKRKRIGQRRRGARSQM